MSRSDFKPTLSELYAESLCPCCGEVRDTALDECVTIGCPLYLSVTNSLEAESVLSPMRDTRELRGEDEMFLVKETG